eukprot:gene3543-3784_t
MVRGHAKAVSQEKHAAKLADKAKSMKRDSAESKRVKEAGINIVCPICKQGMPNVGVYRTHYENRHPSSPLPPELQPSAESK